MIRRFLCLIGFHRYHVVTAMLVPTPQGTFRVTYRECQCGADFLR